MRQSQPAEVREERRHTQGEHDSMQQLRVGGRRREQIDQGCRPACSCADERPCACTCEIFADPDSQPQRREVAAGPRRRRGGEEGEHPDKYETYPEQRRRVLHGQGCSGAPTSRGWVSLMADLSNIIRS